MNSHIKTRVLRESPLIRFRHLSAPPSGLSDRYTRD